MTQRIIISMLVVAGICISDAFSQKNLLGIMDFQEPLGDWMEAGDVTLDTGDSTKLDSWGKEEVGSGDCGGIYERYDENRKENQHFEGTAPPLNASKKPGEWQNLAIKFKAPRFNSKGEKNKNAIFKELKLNGITLHKHVSLSGPTASSLDDKEESTGPLMLQGDHGPVAFRNIRIR